MPSSGCGAGWTRTARTSLAARHYTTVFPDSGVRHTLRSASGEESDAGETIKRAAFTLAGQEFGAMDSARARSVGFNEAISFMVGCESQDEIDYYWDSLSAVPEAEQCGWLRDRFGSLQMEKLDVAEPRRAYDEEGTRV